MVCAVLYLALWPLASAAEDSQSPSAPPRSAPPQTPTENDDSPAAQQSKSTAPTGDDAGESSQPQAFTQGFTLIGVLPLKDESTVRGGAEQLAAMLKDRLGARFEDVQFIAVDPKTAGIDGDPTLIENARKLGRQFNVQALLTGVFGGIEITGGTWPNRGSDMLEARGALSWRLIDCEGGGLAAAGEIAPRKPKVYSQRIRSAEGLIRSVMQGLVTDVGDTLEGAGLLAGVPAPVQASPAVKSKAVGGAQ